MMRLNAKRVVLLAAASAGFLLSQEAPHEQAGPLPDGGFLLNSGWRIKAEGLQIPVDTLPMASAISPDKKYLLVLNAGYNPPSVSVIDIAAGKELSRAAVPDAWLGLTITKAGDKVYVGGGSQASIYEFNFAGGKLTPSRVFPIVAEKDRKAQDFIGDVAISPDGHLLYAADLYRDSIVVVNPQSGLVLSRFKTGRRPYRILFHPSGKSLFVSSWSDGSIGQYDVANGSELSNIRVAPHTTDMVWLEGEVEDQPSLTARMFVSASNTNNVYVLGATETGALSRLETISLALTTRQPLGSTPAALGLSSDGKKLFVACSDVNAAVVVDVSQARSQILGFVPTGWYPTAAFGLPDGRMGVLNGKGPKTGTVQFTEVADDQKLEAYTQEVIANSPYRDELLDDAGAPADTPLRANGPIKHVIYIVREGRTYDEVLGDIQGGNGQAALARFGEKVTPNQHRLARDFGLLDNFYVNADGTAEGHNFAAAAIAPEYTVKLSPNSEAGRRKNNDYEGQEPANTPPAGYIWTNAAQAGISMRNYGFFADNLAMPGADGEQISTVRDPVLAPVTDKKFRSFDTDYTDANRAKAFIEDLHDFEQAGAMPQFLVIRLGNDRGSGTTPGGTTPGKIAPLSAVADNDQGLGMIVEAVSKSKFWGETAIFVVDSAAGNGPDHVDSHRSICFVVSPWVRRGVANSTMYNQASVLRTMELILGLHPMTTYDAAARPMFNVFTAAPNPASYATEKPQTPLDARNP